MKKLLLVNWKGQDAHDEYERSLDKVEDRMENPPPTWAAYAHKPHGLFDIIEMEHKELEAMRESGTHAQVVKELYDLAAAALCAAHKMTCPDEDKRHA